MPGMSEGFVHVQRHYDVEVAHAPTQKLRHRLVNVKDKLPKEKFLLFTGSLVKTVIVYILSRRVKQHVGRQQEKSVFECLGRARRKLEPSNRLG